MENIEKLGVVSLAILAFGSSLPESRTKNALV